MTRTIPSRSTAGIRSKGSHSSSTKVHVNVDTRTLADSLMGSSAIAAISSSSLVDRSHGHGYGFCVVFISCDSCLSSTYSLCYALGSGSTDRVLGDGVELSTMYVVSTMKVHNGMRQ